MKTSFLKKADISKQWILIDATNAVVGRLAAFIAIVLKGKHKADYTPYMDCGDNVIVINADKVIFTGKKMKDKIYYRHTGYMGGIKSTTSGDIFRGRFPERVLKMAIMRMLSKGNLGHDISKHVYVYSGPNHKHSAQQPKSIDFSSLNSKNVRK